MRGASFLLLALFLAGCTTTREPVCGAPPAIGSIDEAHAVAIARAWWAQRADGPPANATAQARHVVVTPDAHVFARTDAGCDELVGGTAFPPADGKVHDAWYVALRVMPNATQPTPTAMDAWIAFVDSTSGAALAPQRVS